ncbi:MAG: 5'-methylthioadenosine/S-adenosylhomocysteine nucleosidase [Acholeplasmataceae bacterium]
MRLIVIAMQSEAEMLIANIKPNDEGLYLLNVDTAVLVTGIGKVNAAAKLSYILAKYSVKSVFNIGLSGATAPFMLNEFVLVKEAQYHDFDLMVFGYERGQVPKLPTRFTSDKELFNKIKALGYRDTLLLTGDKFLQEQLEEKFLCDMEGAGLYQVCHIHKIPIVSVKMVSDIIGSKDHIQQFKAFDQEQAGVEIKKIVQKVLAVLV